LISRLAVAVLLEEQLIILVQLLPLEALRLAVLALEGPIKLSSTTTAISKQELASHAAAIL